MSPVAMRRQGFRPGSDGLVCPVRLAAFLEAAAVGAPTPTVHALTDDQRSWAIHAPAHRTLDKSSFDRLWATRPDTPPEIVMFGRRIAAPRRQRSFGVDYAFSGAVARAGPLRDETLVLDLARQFRAGLEAASGAPGPALGADQTERETQGRVGALLNFYDAAEGDYIGPHADDERSLVGGCPIFSFSFGQTRRFRLVPRPAQAGAKTVSLSLGSGDLLVMGGACQQTHKHEIIKPNKAERCDVAGTRRINLTFRVHRPPSSAPASALGKRRRLGAASTRRPHDATPAPRSQPLVP